MHKLWKRRRRRWKRRILYDYCNFESARSFPQCGSGFSRRREAARASFVNWSDVRRARAYGEKMKALFLFPLSRTPSSFPHVFRFPPIFSAVPTPRRARAIRRVPFRPSSRVIRAILKADTHHRDRHARRIISIIGRLMARVTKDG